MAPTAYAPVAARVVERRRAVALARHYRDAEGLSIAQIADRLGRSPATIKAYLYDPTGEKARAGKARYQGVCRGCGAYTQPRNGKGDAYAYCKSGSSSAQPVPHGALVGVFGQSFEPISLELRRDWVCRGAEGFRHA
jgi:Homeodomain-like domain